MQDLNTPESYLPASWSMSELQILRGQPPVCGLSEPELESNEADVNLSFDKHVSTSFIFQSSRESRK